MKRVLIVALLASAALIAQSFDRTKPPEPSAPHPYKLPPVFEARLLNGLTVVLVEDARVPLVTVRLAFHCGNRRDPKELPGLASAVADLMTQATSTRGFIQIVEAVDTMGGSLNASSGADHVAVNGSIESENLAPLLDIMADVAKNAEFSDIDLRLYKQNRKQTLARQFAQNSYIANYVFRQVLFGDHPYSHIGPTYDSLDRLTHQALVDYRNIWLVPNNGFLIMVGRLPPRADTLKMIAERFGAWERKTLPEVKRELAPAPAKRLILIDRPGAAQVDVRIGRIAATQRDPDYFAEWAGSIIVGGVPLGRMFLDLREKRGFAYDVRTEHVAFNEAGILSSTIQVRNEVAGDAIRAMIEHLDRMASEPVTAKELADAKSSAAGSFLLHLETQAGLADELMVNAIQELGPGFLESWRTGMEAVKAEDVQAAAKKFLATQDSLVVVVGDASKIQESLTGIGKLEIVKAGN